MAGPSLAPAIVAMHGIGSRRDLPLPFEYVVAGSAAVLLITFGLALWAWRTPRYEVPRGVPLRRLTRLLDAPVARTAGLLVSWFVLAWYGFALVAGPDRLSNPAFGFVFACVWVGLVPVSLLFGHVWRELHPLRVLGARRTMPPARDLGVYPAALGLLLFAWFELIQPGRATKPVLLAWTAGWLVVMCVGVIRRGPGWLSTADPFTGFADLIATLSPWRRIDGELHLVNPLSNLTTCATPRGTWAVVSVLLGATAFDSWSGGAGWVSFVQSHRLNPVLAGVCGLACTTSVVAGTLAGAVALMRSRLRPDVDQRGLLDVMAGTVAPIVAGYAIGHYASLLAIEGQRTLINASDPLGLGWNVFGTAELGVGTALFDHPGLVAMVQLVSIVTGHVVGVLAAHERSLKLLRADGVLRGQLGLLVVMIGYTCAGLLLLFSA